MSSSSKTLRGDQYYGLNRDAIETKRLNDQHEQLKKSFGFVLHPSIPIPSSRANSNPIRIADFATGTGVWLLDIAKQYPDFSYDGVDISPAQFPPKESLPKNVRFHEHDIVKPLREEWKGVFDIINIRLVVLGLAPDQWEVVVRNLVEGLKPGGWIQWVDADNSPTGLKIVQLRGNGARSQLIRGIEVVRKWAKLSGRDLSKCNELPSMFAKSGLGNIHHDVMSGTINDTSTMRKDTSVLLSACFSQVLVKYAEMEESEISVEEAKELEKGMLEEASKGESYMRLDYSIVTGQKPLEVKRKLGASPSKI